ncbi:methylenetetrahydrofolate reductase [uncultured Algibacter sp.]|uniref:methylenetetrahydrofolate reductase n=1 Tax=uncultured Algibacter sp. TaxID=298659 RepID=UPI002615C612|nr:methylenetetrahydrofolate reductase [uncultured Algibacter sp.]
MLEDKIRNRNSGILLYGLTPPKLQADINKIQTIANKQIERISGLELDGLVLYDIQDESSRNDSPRPFPFMETLSPDVYSANYLKDLNLPKIIYKSVGKYSKQELSNWIQENSKDINFSVFVGTPSNKQKSSLSLNDAYSVNRIADASITLGGVTIPERHYKKNDEHQRLFSKIDKGCHFFISQCVYNINNTKNFLSDYYYSSLDNHRELLPIIFTLTPCGSIKTMEFMEWLGIDIPQWLKNDLKHSEDILTKSIDVCKTIAKELLDYCAGKNIPIGFNIESVSIRKAEIEASIELLKDVKEMMNKYETSAVSLR